MAISISLRTDQFGDAQLDSAHFNSNAYASFVVSSSDTNISDGAVANINDLSALASTLSTNIDSIMQSLSGVLGGGASYTDSTDTWSFGTINLASSASGTYTDWTAVIEAIDGALATAEGDISTNASNISTNAGNIATNTTNIATNAGNISTLRTHVNTALGTTVPDFIVDAATPFIGSTANPAQTEDVKSYIEALAGQIQSSIVGLGSVFEYKDATSVDPQGQATTPSTDPNDTLATRSSWTAGVEFQDLSTLPDKESGDYYKAASTGWVSYDGTGANAIFVNQGDGIVWNTSTPTPTIDKIDNTDFNVTGTGNISVTGDISVGFNVDSTAIDGAISGNTSSISALQSELDGTQSMLGMVAGSSLSPTVSEDGNGGYQFPSITAPTAAQYFERDGTQNGSVTTYFTTRAVSQDLVTTLSAIQSEAQTGLGDLEAFQKNLATGLGFPIQSTGHYALAGRTGTTFLKGQDSISGELSKLDAVIVSLQTALGIGNSSTNTGGIEAVLSNAADPASMNFAYVPFTGTNYIDGNASFKQDILDLDSALGTLATSAGDLRTDVEAILGVNAADLDTNGTASNLTTTAKTIVPAINELDSEVATNTSNISTNTSNISTNTTNITNNSSAIASNDSDIANIVASVELNANGTKTNFDSDGQGATFNITAGGTFKTAIQELDQALQVSQIVDTGRLTVAPMSHQYAEYTRLADVNDLADYASQAFGADATNYVNPNPTGTGDLHDFEVTEQQVVLGARPSNAPNPLHSNGASHLNNQNYWYNVKVFKNGVRLFQRNPNAALKASSDEYKMTEVVYPATYPANYDADERYPMVIPSHIYSTYRLNQTVGLSLGDPDPDAGLPHPLAGMKNIDDAGNPFGDPTLVGVAMPMAGQTKYWAIEFGAPLNAQDIIVVDYMGLKD